MKSQVKQATVQSVFGSTTCTQYANSFRAIVCKTVPLYYRTVICLSVMFVTLAYCGQTAAWIKMKLGTEVGLGPGDIVSDGVPAPPTQTGTAPPNFRSMPIVAKWLDGSRCHLIWRSASAQATLCYMGTQLTPHKKGVQPPIFGPCLLWQNSWMDQDAT